MNLAKLKKLYIVAQSHIFFVMNRSAYVLNDNILFTIIIIISRGGFKGGVLYRGAVQAPPYQNQLGEAPPELLAPSFLIIRGVQGTTLSYLLLFKQRFLYNLHKLRIFLNEV